MPAVSFPTVLAWVAVAASPFGAPVDCDGSVDESVGLFVKVTRFISAWMLHCLRLSGSPPFFFLEALAAVASAIVALGAPPATELQAGWSETFESVYISFLAEGGSTVADGGDQCPVIFFGLWEESAIHTMTP